ncbi:MAG: hypothetical protein M3Q71_14530 [Chloroflexota bacterium]|nr:hypothetical protein [Chloroflexota bacterium]MDP9471853.1 hypothetical protein [Chloroflexota bacterium]
MTTKADTTGHALSVAQLNAADCLAAGMNDGETAAAVGVSRQTVCGWRNHHPGFIAALNARRLETWGASSDRLRALLPKALDCLEAAITGEAPDWKAAAKVVELAGLDRQGAGVPNLGPSSIGPTDPEAVIEAEAKRRRRDPLQDIIDGGRVTETERRAVLRELNELAG